jgi:hypothetical protein
MTVRQCHVEKRHGDIPQTWYQKWMINRMIAYNDE